MITHVAAMLCDSVLVLLSHVVRFGLKFWWAVVYGWKQGSFRLCTAGHKVTLGEVSGAKRVHMSEVVNIVKHACIGDARMLM